jgi:ABC-2 type transport system ATP-binding protein
MISFEQVTRAFGSQLAVECLDLDIARGEIFALLGHNGAGKTTTLKMLVGLLRPTRGRVIVGPYDVTLNPRESSRLVGYVPDQPFLYDKLSGGEFLTFVADMHGLTARESRLAVERESERFQLGDFLDRLTETYSHGMRQRTVFAAAMIHQPEVLIVDEPMVGLDPQSIKLVKDLLQSYASSGKTIILSTHTLSVAEEISDRIGVMKTGRILFEGPVDQLRLEIPTSKDSLESMYLALMERGE